jgi:hypothetical protein
MATLSQARKEEIAKELKIVATWVAGPRQTKVLALAAEIIGEDEPPQLPLETPAPPEPKGKDKAS